MKSVATHTHGPIILGDCIGGCDIGIGRMKRRPKGRELWQIGREGLQRANARKVVGVVQRCERRRGFNPGNHIVIDATGCNKGRATMNNTVGGGGQLVDGDALRRQRPKDRIQRGVMIGLR